ncbi:MULTISPECIES: hypothetical protein [Brevibacterium]|uniref:DUF222 domain-containing protein n=1 Tax=Brevibacterium salitolerans TaxID=1403566 RepID=A0ABN2X430_9MICO|nr:hypothetical protein [Brevibacterium sp.]
MSSAFGIPATGPEIAPGVEHNPELSQESLEELTPFLEEEGIDLDDPSSIDPDRLDAALARATRRRNDLLFSAEGERRLQSIALLGEIAEAVIAGQLPVAQALLRAVEPDPTPALPSVAQVIGTALELIDTWHADAELTPASMLIPVPKVPKKTGWDRRSRNAAVDVLAIARKGRARDSLGSLILRYAGTAVLEGSALAVTGFFLAAAKRTGADAAALGQELLLREAPGVTSLREVFSAPEPVRADSLAAPASDPELRPETVRPQESAGRVSTAPAAAAEPVPEAVEAQANASPEVPVASGTEAVPGGESDSGHAAPAAAEAPAAQGEAVLALLEWMGAGQPIARSGGLRRADIEPVAALLGINAKGVNRRVQNEPGDSTVYAMSMAEVPELASWWQELLDSQIIETTATRVKPGPAATSLREGA